MGDRPQHSGKTSQADRPTSRKKYQELLALLEEQKESLLRRGQTLAARNIQADIDGIRKLLQGEAL